MRVPLGAPLSWNNGDGHTVREMATTQVRHFNGMNLSVSQITLVGIVTAILAVNELLRRNGLGHTTAKLLTGAREAQLNSARVGVSPNIAPTGVHACVSTCFATLCPRYSSLNAYLWQHCV